VAWYKEQSVSRPALIYATDTPEAIKAVQQQLGVDAAGTLVEGVMAEVVRQLAQAGIRKFIVAGGETSGSVVQALNISAIKIGQSIAPGVPLTESISAQPQLLALKSGNFGDRDFFAKAVEAML